LILDTTTAGGDTGAHVWWPAFLRDFLLPEGKFAGWSNDYYNGFPAGQFYFPIPALLVVLLDVVLPYNIAFKFVTAIGPLALPWAAYVFGRGLRLRFPAPAFMGLATLAFLLFAGDQRTTAPYTNAAFNQRIMGGTLASNLAGEFSFTIALCFALAFLGVFAVTLRGGRRPVWAVLLLAATILSHVIVGIFVAVGAFVVLAFRFMLDPSRGEDGDVRRRAGLFAGGALLVTVFVGVLTISVWWALPFGLVAIAAVVWFTRFDPNRVLIIAAVTGGVAAMLTAFWSIPLVSRFPYTSNMAYEKLITAFNLGDPADGFNLYLFPFGAGGVFPWVFIFGLIGLAAAIVFWRPGVIVLATLTLLMGVLFVQWPELHAWNLRFLPFWYLGWMFLAAIGLADLVRVPGHLIEPAGESSLVPGSVPTAMPTAVGIAVGIAVGTEIPVPEPRPTLPAGIDPVLVARERRVNRIWTMSMTGALALAVGVVGLATAATNPGFLTYWAEYNYTGYEWTSPEALAGAEPVAVPASGPCSAPHRRADSYRRSAKSYPEYAEIMKTMSELPPGRALWEGGSSIDKYGTTLALMLLPYCTEDRIASSEGLYFEASGTTAYHFITVSELASAPSNPMRFPGIPTPYGQISERFDLGIRHLQMLGIRYYMAQSDTAKSLADAHPSLRLVASTNDRDQQAPLGWKIYEVQDAPTIEPLQYAPVVVRGKGPAGWQQSGSAWLTDWFNDSDAIDRVLVSDGPNEWVRAGADEARSLPFGEQLPAVEITNVREEQQAISFTVSQTGVPILVKTSYYPNWQVTGAASIHRASPNFMVVVPTSNEVRLEFKRSSFDWLGLVLTLFGLVALVPVARWKPRLAYPEDMAETDRELLLPVDAVGDASTGLGGAPPVSAGFEHQAGAREGGSVLANAAPSGAPDESSGDEEPPPRPFGAPADS